MPALAFCKKIVESSDARITGEATHVNDALRWAAVSNPDVLLLEYSEHLAQTARGVLARIPHVSASTRVLLLCDRYTHQSVVGFIQWGASGCLLASSPPVFCAKAVRSVHEGETWFGRTEL